MIQYAKLTGRHYDGAVEVIALHGVTLMARPVYSFPLISLPSEQWLEDYGSSYLAVIDYEQGKNERPLFMGVIPLTDGAPFPNTAEGAKTFIVTKKHQMTFADDVNVWAVKQKDGDRQTFRINEHYAFIKSPDFRLGDAAATEKMLLGSSTVSLLHRVLTAIQQLTVPTGFGPSGVPLNSPAFAQLATELDALLSATNKLI